MPGVVASRDPALRRSGSGSAAGGCLRVGGRVGCVNRRFSGGVYRISRLAEYCVKIVFWFHSCHILRVCVVCQLLWRVFCFCAYIAEHRFDDPHRALCSTQGEGVVYRGKLTEQIGLLTAQVRC